MIFQHTYQKALSKSKTQTRRLVHARDFGLYRHGRIEEVWRVDGVFAQEYARWLMDNDGHHAGDMLLWPARLRWSVGRTYAVQLGRGKPTVARIRLTGIRLQHLQEISEWEAYAEGFWATPCQACLGMGRVGSEMCHECDGTCIEQGARDEFGSAWDVIHPRAGERWQDNPRVWVLEFELAENA